MIAGRQFWLWRAVDDEGEVLDLLVQRRRDKVAAVKLMRKLLKKQGFAPAVLVTDKLPLTARQGPRLRCHVIEAPTRSGIAVRNFKRPRRPGATCRRKPRECRAILWRWKSCQDARTSWWRTQSCGTGLRRTISLLTGKKRGKSYETRAKKRRQRAQGPDITKNSASIP
jgi:transposase-like protein